MGFLAGSLLLIVLETLLQPNAANAASAGAGASVSILRRALSGDVAGVPLKAHTAGPATVEPPLPPSQGGPGILIPPSGL